MFHGWARHLRGVERNIHVYVKRDVYTSGKRRVYSIYEWAISHARARYLRDVKRNVYIYVKRDVCRFGKRCVYSTFE